MRCIHPILLAAIAVAIAIAAIPAQAQEDKKVHLSFEGPDVFCHVLHAKKILPAKSFDDALETPKHSIIIILGDPRKETVRGFWKSSIERYLDAGGSVLIATDYFLRIYFHRVENPLLTITGIPVVQPKEKCFGEIPTCPWIEYDPPAAKGFADPRDHPVFSQLSKRIATNCPSFLRVAADSKLQGIFLVPRRFGPDANLDNAPPGSLRTYMAISPKGTPPRGRALVIAGHGLFMNGMMLQPETDNLSFAMKAVDWLREAEGGGKRTQALLVVNGKIVTDFNRNLTPPPPPLPMPTVAMVNRLLRGLEDERFFHMVFRELLGEQYERVVPVLMALATCVVLLYGAKKLLDGRGFHEVAVPRMVGAATTAASTAPRPGPQRPAQYRPESAWEESRRLARLWLQSEFGIAAESWPANTHAAMSAGGTFWLRGRLQRQADFVLRLATSATPINVSRREFAELLHGLEWLSQALRAGRLTLLLDGKEVRQTEPAT